ncbi:HBR483Wp [Eremothecium sinecaudum]|uniref:HBR483Wp n=1 Tax=Eremothecium sinecaudum TaxID=45286 RepID=A0A120K1G9_9SACH|nr:HBR483Wp [Eremothecium sinecaudum]AMD19384.1 HBR483Wp [Eremothecium sinecaudum]
MMGVYCYILLLISLATEALANTESFNLYIPSDFPLRADNKGPGISHGFPSISLHKVNHRLETFNVPLDEMFYVQVDGLRHNENYHIRVCWTAADPLDIKNLGYLIVPHHSEFMGTEAEDARIFLHFLASPASEPPMKAAMIPVNVSVVNTKLGIPVDLYSLLVYIFVIMGGVMIAVRHFDPYRMLKEAC